jgi:hypothetical protein
VHVKRGSRNQYINPGEGGGDGSGEASSATERATRPRKLMDVTAPGGV